MSDFKDYIPAGEDPGGLGAGFTDFVPPKEPVKQPEPVKEPEVKKQPEQPQTPEKGDK